MNKLRLIIIAFFIFSLNSCATLMFQPVNNDLGTWMGASEDELYISWGPPNAMQHLNNGNKIVVYTDAYNQSTGGYYLNGTWIAHHDSHLSCKIIFTIDKNNIIISYSYEGNFGPVRRIVKPRY